MSTNTELNALNKLEAIARQAKAEGVDRYFWDESGLHTDAVQDKTPVMNRSGQRQSVSVASAVHAKGAFWFATYPGRLTGELFIELLQRLMYRRKKPLHLIADGLPAHKKAVVKDHVARRRVASPHFLPGYADLNPDEMGME